MVGEARATVQRTLTMKGDADRHAVALGYAGWPFMTQRLHGSR
jgi:putative AlgH/UPF0301 family transcriptional regulator